MEKKKIELKLNESIRLKLTKDRCYEGKSAYGPYWLYSVANGDGVEQSFFAPAEIHQQIVAHGLKAGSEFILTKKPGQNGKKLTGELVFEAIEGTESKPSNGYKATMTECLRDAYDISKELTDLSLRVDDIRSIALTLYISRTKQNGYA